MTLIYPIRAALFGVATGDALGVPVEFCSREQLLTAPVTAMRSFGTHQQPAGTWSDDSSLTFCLAEALTQRYDTGLIADYFVQWRYKGYWTPWGQVFDIGNATHAAIRLLHDGIDPIMAGGIDEDSNGNGSLMRILPLVFEVYKQPVSERYLRIKEVSSLTHGHIRAVIACFYYMEFARLALLGVDKREIYRQLQGFISDELTTRAINPSEVVLFRRLLQEDISSYPVTAIHSSGYVLHTLEAAIWCIMTTDDYREAVLAAVNLGSDTDTTGAVVGGLAALLYGYESIPSEWAAELARKQDIERLAQRMASRYDKLLSATGLLA